MRLAEFEGRISADAFYGTAELFLCSHGHRDHLQGLGRGWNRGKIAATESTARLLQALYHIPKDCIEVLLLNTTRRFPLGGGEVAVTALPANHCPGSCMFFVEGERAQALWTGDFRLDAEMKDRMAALPTLDALYVDTTYRGTGYRFPRVGEAIQEVVRIARSHRDGEIFLGIYDLGKEPVVEAVAAALGRPVYVSERRHRIFQILGEPEWITRRREETTLRAYSRFYLEKYARVRSGSVAIIPTGFAAAGWKRPRFFYVPYSEHCDAEELEAFLRIVRARRVMPIEP